MRSVLGIDAAWTDTKPSGVALAGETETGWRLLAVAPSYERFHAAAEIGTVPRGPHTGLSPDAPGLLAASHSLCGRGVDLIAIDMPLARSRIAGRRVSDDAVSRAYGARKCSTHTPNIHRPGRISDDLTSGLASLGYPLQTESIKPPGLIEVYPHPALVELFGACERLPYKSANVRRYWPKASPGQRRAELFSIWETIVRRLDTEISGVADAMQILSTGASGMEIKGYEDKLDAVVCAWVAIRALNGDAVPFGDHDSAIWIPAPIGAPEVAGGS